MRRLLVFVATAIGAVSPAFAGAAPAGYSTFQITWAAQVPAAVPTLGTYATLALAALLAVVAFRLTRNQRWLVKAITPVAAFGLSTAVMIGAERTVAGMALSAIDASDCSGSETYTAGDSAPPCFKNTCGKPVNVSYTFIEGEDFEGSPLTAESCTLDYYCDEGGGFSAPPALEGDDIPSNGAALGTAFCAEILGGEI